MTQETESPEAKKFTSKHDRLDRTLVKFFPWFICVCLVFIVLLIYLLENYTVGGILYAICLGFVVGFSVLGFCSLLGADIGLLKRRYVIGILIVIPLAVSTFLWTLGEDFQPNKFLVRFFDILNADVSWFSLTMTTYTIELMLMLVAYGVVSVVVGYFRIYIYRVLLSLENKATTRKSMIPKVMFQVPDIIDIQEVVLEPENEPSRFDVSLFLRVAIADFLIGIAICSYVFLNPYFLGEIPAEEMMAIAIMLSMFLSTLVIPWNILQSVGAKIKSQAPRDYYLWKGLRGRLYQGFFAIAFFMMLILMSAYLGMDFHQIATTYIGYIMFLGAISVSTAFVYVNSFYKGFRDGIINSFNKGKTRKKKD